MYIKREEGERERGREREREKRESAFISIYPNQNPNPNPPSKTTRKPPTIQPSNIQINVPSTSTSTHKHPPHTPISRPTHFSPTSPHLLHIHITHHKIIHRCSNRAQRHRYGSCACVHLVVCVSEESMWRMGTEGGWGE
ncbi:hypothetical protein M430DRAFT_64941 [Amorphotheca resinae ATCC 22711]|uniref:Uncharacterized protein n=1 Tax=Amorphotheca resinae ATCC 22711 TaxID=857342 RepID=A0A2T3B8Y4_AMORE|nr:hypothetical protein M430DRAFT_64941 [Amorphotheca resinae ATCC 22711]PSS23301.1 hypothetical protein M430DRAFT_64941 [Amorphotheca resinae ATCC 22711]